MLDKNPDARPDARSLVNGLQELHPKTTEPSPERPSSNRVPRLLPALAFVTPFAIFMLIGLGIIVIEYFLPVPPNAASVSPPPEPSVVQQSDLPPETNEDAASASPPPSPVDNAARPESSSDAYLAGLDKKRVELRIKRTELLLEYTTQHPDVVQIDRQLEQLRDERRRYLRQLKSSRPNN
jgi:serine/threonine-protein kinase